MSWRKCLLIISVCGGLLLGGQTPGWIVPSQAAPLKVAATIFPLYDLVRQVAGPTVEVVLLVPPEASEHTFTVKPGTIRALSGCQAVFAIGHGLDDWVVRLARDAGVPQVRLTDNHISLRRGYNEPAERHHHAEHRHGVAHAATPTGVDPHYWLAVPNALLMVETIVESLGQLNPAGREEYQRRAQAYQEELRAADAAIRALLQDLPQRDIATFHMAFGYFAEAYGLQVVAVFEPVPGKEPGPRYVEAFQRQLRAHNLRTVFIEPQLSDAALQGLSRDLGVTLQTLDPLGGIGERTTYLAMMQFNARQIAAALGQ